MNGAGTWLEWLAPSLTVVLAVLAALVGMELVRFNVARRLDGLRSAHWTERARVFTETNNNLRLFSGYLLTVTSLLLMLAVPDLGPQPILRFCAGVTLCASLLGDPLGPRWIRRASAGSLTPASWLEVQGFTLLMFPSRWLLIAFGLLAPQRYDVSGWLWASALVLTLGVAQAGGGALLCRALGILRPASAELRQLVASVAQAAGVREPPVYVLKLVRANALALPMLGWVAFTSAAVQHLEPQALSVIAAHELGHLRESLAVKLTRIAVGVSMSLTIVLVPAFPQEPLLGVAYGFGSFALVALGMRVLSVRLERRADALAHEHEHARGDYAAALERVYELNWMPAGAVSRTHPSLYDRMEQAGVRPDYARPKPPARGPKLLALAFGLVIALGLVFIVCPLLADLLASLTQR